jgi:acetyl-CoA carboxylase biotin carboxyl carrier protein
MRAKGSKGAKGKTAKSGDVVPTSAAHPLEGRIDALAEILRRHDLNEIEVEDAEVRIYLRRGSDGGAAQVVHAPVAAHGPLSGALAAVPVAAPAAAAVSGAAAAGSVDTSDGNVAYVTSPFVGTFYRSPSPDAAAFVDVGTRVRKGQVLCIVEAMKLMNEIESEIEGVVVQILVENGQAVEYGEPLFKIKQG